MSKLRITVELSKILNTVGTPQEIKAIKNAITYLQSIPLDSDLGNLPIYPPEWFYKLMREYYSPKNDVTIIDVWGEISGRLSKPLNPVEPKWYEKLKPGDTLKSDIYPSKTHIFRKLVTYIETTENAILHLDRCYKYSAPTTEEIIKELKASLTEEQKKLVEQIPYQFVKLK